MVTTLMIPVFCHLPSQRRHFIFALFYVRQWTQVSCCCRGKNRSTGRFYRLQTDSNSTANCNVSLIYTGTGSAITQWSCFMSLICSPSVHGMSCSKHVILRHKIIISIDFCRLFYCNIWNRYWFPSSCWRKLGSFYQSSFNYLQRTISVLNF